MNWSSNHTALGCSGEKNEIIWGERKLLKPGLFKALIGMIMEHWEFQEEFSRELESTSR